MSRVLVLCYHAVSERWPASLAVTPTSLADQLTMLVRRGYRGVTFSEAVTADDEGRRVAVTFDDAYTSVFRLALPVLESLRLPGTVFAPTGFIGKGGAMRWAGIDGWLGTEHEHELTGMSWSQLRTLLDHGWEIGSHTHTHPRLTTLADAALREQLRVSKAECERQLGVACTSIAYPYGDVDRRVASAAQQAGYAAGAALPGSERHPHPLTYPRTGVYYKDAAWRFRLKASGGVRLLRRSPTWTLLERTRTRS